MFPQTITIYNCSNEVCQDEKDRETAKRIKIQKDKEFSKRHPAKRVL